MFTDLLVERPDHPDRLAALEEALALWHGEALDEFRHEPWAAPEVARLDELRALAIEDRAELLIDPVAPRLRRWRRSRRTSPPIPSATDPAACSSRPWPARGAKPRHCGPTRRTSSFLAEEIGTEPSAIVRSIERRVAAGGWVDDPADAADRASDHSRPRKIARSSSCPSPAS